MARTLADLAHGFRSVSDVADRVLAISTMQTVAGNWLASRIGSFQMAHPELAVRLDISNDLANFVRDGIDAAIRSGRGKWPELTAHRLFGQDFVAVASPAYLAREGRPATPRDMLRHVLIAPSDDWWDIWFAKAGVPPPIAIARPGIDVGTQHEGEVIYFCFQVVRELFQGIGIRHLNPLHQNHISCIGRPIDGFNSGQ